MDDIHTMTAEGLYESTEINPTIVPSTGEYGRIAVLTVTSIVKRHDKIAVGRMIDQLGNIVTLLAPAATNASNEYEGEL